MKYLFNNSWFRILIFSHICVCSLQEDSNRISFLGTKVKFHKYIYLNFNCSFLFNNILLNPSPPSDLLFNFLIIRCLAPPPLLRSACSQSLLASPSQLTAAGPWPILCPDLLSRATTTTTSEESLLRPSKVG